MINHSLSPLWLSFDEFKCESYASLCQRVRNLVESGGHPVGHPLRETLVRETLVFGIAPENRH